METTSLKELSILVAWPIDPALFKIIKRPGVYRHTLDLTGSCSKRGLSAEDQFYRTITEHWPHSIQVPHSCILQMRYHVDAIIVLDIIDETQAEVVFVDVKSAKKASRGSDAIDYDYMWLELQNDTVDGFTWLGTKVKYAGPCLGPQIDHADSALFPNLIVVPEQNLYLDRRRLTELALRSMQWSEGFVRTAAKAIWRPYRRYMKSFEIITRAPMTEVIEYASCGSTSDLSHVKPKISDDCPTTVLGDLCAYIDSI
jgi:hypothetical protein